VVRNCPYLVYFVVDGAADTVRSRHRPPRCPQACAS
jgi:hypothetical protein